MARLLERVTHVASSADMDVDVDGLCYRSSEVRPGDAFVCIRGYRADGHDFAADAVSRHATALVVERFLDLDVPQFRVGDARSALALASCAFHEHPSRSIGVVGITGTNGKTTVTYLLDSIWRSEGRTTGMVGTVETRIGGESFPADRTTPESLDLQRLFARMRDAGVTGCALEVSSHALDLKRVDGTRFSAVAFTNLTQDHLDHHHTIDDYFEAKSRLFREFDTGARVIDVDDPRGAQLAAPFPDALTVGRSAEATVRAELEVPRATGTRFRLLTPWGDAEVDLPVAGAYNVSNALCAAACALAGGTALADVVSGLESAPQVPGRLERVDCDAVFSAVVDYAHTPDSLEKALAAVRAFTEGHVIVVFGCGGDRDPDKRPLMGAVAGRGADVVVVTSDNPRSEEPEAIIDAVVGGVRSVGVEPLRIEDRREAIAHALGVAREGDTVLIAGKGHEGYQIFADRTIHFDDREVVREVLGAC